ncbi:MAG: 50S ribosomal protein L28 [Planctomycetota bacterium]|nr:50S ribosomal protein L28 [Planctomycetota bacterium]
MASHCEVCGKGPVAGVFYVRRGLAKAKGGVGRKITGKTKRWFKPNLQKLKVVEKNGHVHRAWVCTGCLRNGKVTKAPNQALARKAREERAK